VVVAEDVNRDVKDVDVQVVHPFLVNPVPPKEVNIIIIKCVESKNVPDVLNNPSVRHVVVVAVTVRLI
jgi:hypothetical protein